MNAAFSAPENCSHPMVRSQYVLDTGPMDSLLKQIATWVDQRVTGAFACAPTRFGKSRTATFAAGGNASDILPAVPMHLMICKRHTVCSETEFLSEILKGFNHEFKSARNRSVLRERIVNFLAVSAQSCGQRQVVLLCDEAQNMHVPEYHTLCGIQNDLDQLGIRLTVISLGAPELWSIHQMLIKSKETYLAARFLNRNMRFRGIQSENELRFVLQQYDGTTEWPEGSRLSYTQYFFPNSFADGFRIEELTPYLWQAFLMQAPKLGNFPLEVPMESVSHSIEGVFRKLPDIQIADQRRSEHERGQISKSLEKILEELAFPEYMNGLICDLRGEST